MIMRVLDTVMIIRASGDKDDKDTTKETLSTLKETDR